MKKLYSILLIYCIIFFYGCQAEEDRTLNEQNSFCYWKTTFNFEKDDSSLWKETSANHMYIRYFDVVWDASNKEGRPVGSLAFSDSIPCKHFTPTVFFKNNVFTLSDRLGLDSLAQRVSKRITLINQSNNGTSTAKEYSEVLIDCDWTKNSKEKFFYFLERLKAEIPDKEVTTTLRLWQYKNPKLAGIPPVKRVLLMCYNIESANRYDIKNSILSLDNIQKYIDKGNYPLKIDIALPLFRWSILFRDKEFKGVIREASIQEFMGPKFERLSNNLFRVKEEQVIGNFFARPGDEIRVEMLSKEELYEITAYIFSEIKIDKYSRITFFDWNRIYVNQYKTNEIKDLYTANRNN